MASFRGLSGYVEAVRFDGLNGGAVEGWAGSDAVRVGPAGVDGHTFEVVRVARGGRTMVAVPGDWVVRTRDGDVFPVRQGVFPRQYESVDRPWVARKGD